jgi:hypothetical protein
MKQCFLGVMETTWSPAGRFLKGFYGTVAESGTTAVHCFRAVFDEIRRQETNHSTQTPPKP